MKTIAFIPVRGGSKSIPGKNIKLLGGKPLLHWTLEAATRANRIDEVVVSSDSDQILQCAKDFGHDKVTIVRRPDELATDTASTESAMLHYAETTAFDRIVLVQATSPLTEAADLDDAIAHMEAVGADSLLSGTHEFRFRWGPAGQQLVEPQNYAPQTRPRRQDWKGEFVENGAFYVTSRNGLLHSRCRLSGKIAFWVMKGHTAVEIDTPDDWEILEALVRSHARRGPRALAPSHIQLIVTDVDGVLTDGGMYYGTDGEALKKFNTRDGMATSLWRKAGKKIAVVTGEDSPSVIQRAKKLKIDDLYGGVQDKLPVVRSLAERLGVTLDQVAYIGDDINDLGAMAQVGYVACPADAHSSVIEVAHYVCSARGGQGALREFVDHLLGADRG